MENPSDYAPLEANRAVTNEIFADDIEALLERLEGIAAARVVATEAGEIDRIHITASPGHDPTSVRRTVVAALMSEYSLSLDGWRVRVARLREESAPQASWHVQRIEDVVSENSARTVVELRADAETGPRLIGEARGLPDVTNRLRTAASATLAALKSVLGTEDQRATVEGIDIVALAGREAAVVAVSVASTTHSDLYVGASVVETSEAEAVITATLEAIGKRIPARQKRGLVMKDRRQQLESLRTHYRQVRGPQRQTPVAAPVSGEPSAVDDEAEHDLAAPRPERQGGATVGSREEGTRQETERTRTVNKGVMEDDFFRQMVTSGTPVHIRCRDGYQIPEGVLKGFGTYSLLVATETGEELVFKHGIISVRPLSVGPTRK